VPAQHKPGVFSHLPFEIRFPRFRLPAPATFSTARNAHAAPFSARVLPHSPPPFRTAPPPRFRASQPTSASQPAATPDHALAPPPAERLAIPAPTTRTPAAQPHTPPASITPTTQDARSGSPKQQQATRHREVGGLGIGLNLSPRGRDARSAGCVQAKLKYYLRVSTPPTCPRPGESSSNKTARSSLSCRENTTRRPAYQAHL
jgi:hypothetical protein